jgi:hypothetical protein
VLGDMAPERDAVLVSVACRANTRIVKGPRGQHMRHRRALLILVRHCTLSTGVVPQVNSLPGLMKGASKLCCHSDATTLATLGTESGRLRVVCAGQPGPHCWHPPFVRCDP